MAQPYAAAGWWHAGGATAFNKLGSAIAASSAPTQAAAAWQLEARVRVGSLSNFAIERECYVARLAVTFQVRQALL